MVESLNKFSHISFPKQYLYTDSDAILLVVPYVDFFQKGILESVEGRVPRANDDQDDDQDNE